MFGDLDRKTSDPARAALDQYGFPGFQLQRVLDRAQRGDADQRQRRALCMRQAVRFFRHNGRLDDDLFRVSRFHADVANPEHRIADGELRHAGAQRADDAGEIAPRYIRKVCDRRVMPGTHLPVSAVDAGRVHIDEHLTGPGNRIRYVAILHHLRTAVFHEERCFHPASKILLSCQNPTRHTH